MGATLVERMRDAVLGKNTLVKLSELSDLGLENVVVIRPGEELRVSRGEDYRGVLAKGEFGYLFINPHWVEDYALGDASASESFKQAEEEAHQRYRGFFEERSPVNFTEDEVRKRYETWEKNHSLLGQEADKRWIEYAYLRPEALLGLLKGASLVVAPKHLLPKLAKEGSLTNFAELVDGSGEFEFYSDQDGLNHPRVLVSPAKPENSRYEPDKVSRIDSETISLLFNHEDEAPSYHFGMAGFMDLMGRRKLDQRFLQVLKSRDTHFQQIQRTLYTPPLSESEDKLRDVFSKLPKIFDEEGDPDFDPEFERSILRRPEFEGVSLPRRQRRSSSGKIPSNYYGLGGKQHGYRFAGNGYEKKLVEDKQHSIAGLYESFWITPLDTLEEVHERQDFLEALVNDSGQAKIFSALERGINGVVMPFFHLSNMANNISANLLHSRWGAGVRKADFHKDFMSISEMFVEAYEAYSLASDSYISVAREVHVLLAALNSKAGDSPLAKAYEFLKRVVDEKPADYAALAAIFGEELKRSGAHLIQELENYDHTKDPKVDMSKLPKKSEGKSLDAFKSSKLEALLEQFHIQNPVTQGKHEIGIFDRVGTKVAVYSAISDFIRGNRWVRPEVVPGDEGIIDIHNGWYPLTYLQHTKKFVRNDTYLSPDHRVEILDGVNVGGKTIDMKKSFLIVCLALSGMYVPAEHARISLFDRVRFRLKDTGAGDTGAFVKELHEIGYALEAVDRSILLGVDETFTSTNPLEGEALTYGLIRCIAESPNARGIFTSHYPTLHDMAGSVPGVKFAHFPFEETNGKLHFPHRKTDGPNKVGDYALTVARSQGISPEILGYALKHLERLST